MTRDEIVIRIEDICKTLKGPHVSDVERRLLHEDRKDLRRMLAELAPADVLAVKENAK